MTATLGVAVIGHAFMGKAHSGAWRNVGAAFDVPGVRRQLIVGRDEPRTRAAADRLGWTDVATDWREVLQRDDIDIVDICTPGWTHAEIAIAALAAGKHVLVEKPLANTLSEAAAMVAAAADATDRGIQSMVGFNYRRVPALALARELIAAGRLGTVRHVRASYLQDWLSDDAAPMSWRLRKDSAGSGALGDIASHAIDQVQFLLGDTVTEASGRLHTFTGQRPSGVGDTLEAVTVDDAVWSTLRMSGGAIASVEASRVALGRRNALQIEVYGSAGAVSFDLERLNELQFADGTAPAGQQGFTRILVTEPEHPYLEGWWPTGHVLGWEHTFTHQIRDFLQAITSGVPPRPSFADGLQVQRVLDAVERSATADGSIVPVT